MSGREIPIGISDFSEIRQKNQYYIDKTGLICSLLKKNPVKVTLITRPRRFGKTLAMSMLSHFFDVRENSTALFHGLAIEKETELCARWQNRYPTIFLTFKDVIQGREYAKAYSEQYSEVRCYGIAFYKKECLIKRGHFFDA